MSFVTIDYSLQYPRFFALIARLHLGMQRCQADNGWWLCSPCRQLSSSFLGNSRMLMTSSLDM